MIDQVSALREGLRDRYAFERELGRGGMATVFLARDLKHDRPVALKVLHPELAVSLGTERFLREIKLAARLQHPHILTVLDSGETNGRLWFTMPLVEGESLRDRLRRERQLPVEDALRIAREAAQALQYAHAHGVIHRDIKPENLLLTDDGNTLVADFGIARSLASGGDEKLTETGLVVGTPAYMSPEQAAGDKGLDARTDVYSLAAVVYEMLTGEPPFSGATTQAMLVRRLTEPAPSARSVRANLPEGADQAIRKALSPVVADRFGTMAQFAAELAERWMAEGRYTGTTERGIAHTTGSGSRTAAADTVAAPSADVPPSGSTAVPPYRRSAVILGLGILIGLGVLFAWRRNGAGGETGRGTRVVAVLPFDNLGDSGDAYFADGVADEVRTRLAQVAGVEVIARGSSIEYRHTTKRPTEIARELGADYLLTGTVRWEKGSGTSRVRVTPELVDARPGQTARSRWGQQFDASLTDVFQVQGDIATKVADALGLALADSTQRRLTARPTESLDAYDQFLKGEAASQGMAAGDLPSLRQATAYYEQAVKLDSTFALAWVQLSRARSSLLGSSAADSGLQRSALEAAERAQALRPGAPEVALALGEYYGFIASPDNERSLVEYQRGLRVAPDNTDLLSGAALGEFALGRFDSAAARLRRASVLDPRSATTARRLALSQIWLRHLAAADSAADRAIALAPTNVRMVLMKVMARVARGDLPGAQAAVRQAEARIDTTTVLSYLSTFQDLCWVLDDGQQRKVLAMSPSAFDGDRGNWAFVLAQLYYVRKDTAKEAAYADSARLAFRHQLESNPGDPVRHALLGVSLGYLGRNAEAVREAQRAVELLPVRQDAFTGSYIELQLVRTYMLAGEPDRALDALEPLMRRPFYVSPGWLRVDPNFDPIRNHPRFRKLAAETS
jgi:eukaryotic-like serine/threonine-protein kinase